MAEQNSYDFWTRYSNLCLKCKVCPLKSIIKNMRGTTLSCQVERIRNEHWQFLLSALSIDNSLTSVSFKSDLPTLEEQKELWKKRRRKSNESYPVPYGYSPYNISEISRYSARLLTVSQVLITLNIENLPVTKEDAVHLSEGLKNSNIKEFSLRCYPYSDDVIKIVCRGLWSSKVELLDFSACNLSMVGLQYICNILKKHKDRRLVEVFPSILRNQEPISDTLTGLKRVTLNGNPIGDEGVAMICDTICDDYYIKALDLQCCGVTDNGAKSFLTHLICNRAMQLVDLRSNNIDQEVMKKISLQLDVNRYGTLVQHSPLSLWKPCLYSKTVPVRKSKIKTKISKKYSRSRIVRRESKSEPVFRISCEILDSKETNMQDASIQTDEDSIEVDRKEKRMIKLEDRLMKGKLVQESLENLIKKLKLENLNLRQEIVKISNTEDAIMIDHETYSEIKHVFEKFQRFLRVMKEKKLWELVTTLKLDGYEKTELEAVPTDSKGAIIERELSVDGHPQNGPIKKVLVPKPQLRGCTCSNPECTSNQRIEKDNNEAHVNLTQSDPQNKSQFKNVNKAKVRKVFKELKDSYEYPKKAASIPPLILKSLSGDVPDGLKPPPDGLRPPPDGLRPPPDGLRPPPQFNFRHLPPKCTCSSVTEDDFHNCKTRQELFNAVRDEVEREVPYQDYGYICQSGIYPHGMDSSNAYFKDHRNMSPQTAAAQSSNFPYQVENPECFFQMQYGPQAINLPFFSNNSISSVKSLPTNVFPFDTTPQAINLVSREINGTSKDNSPGASNVQESAAINSETNTNLKTDSLESPKQKSHLRNLLNECLDPERESMAQEFHNALVKTFPPGEVIDNSSYSSFVNPSGEFEFTLKSDSNPISDVKSYLESVDDASTDKDVKSISEIEVFDYDHKSDSVTLTNSSDKSSSKPKAACASGGKNINGTKSSASSSGKKPNVSKFSVSGGGKNSNGSKSSVSTSNHTKSSKKNQKHKKNVISNINHGKNVKKKSDSSSSVPSLSDITTVSSRSLNTDSVMGQLSGSEKGGS